MNKTLREARIKSMHSSNFSPNYAFIFVPNNRCVIKKFLGQKTLHQNGNYRYLQITIVTFL